MQRMPAHLRDRIFVYSFALPTYIWLIVLCVVPLIFLIVYSFLKSGVATAVFELSLENYVRLFTSSAYIKLFSKTLVIAVITTTICFVLGYAFAYFLAFKVVKFKSLFLYIVVFPYLTGYLVRIFAWRIILGNKGLINSVLHFIGIGPVNVLFTNIATILGLIYILLPVMTFPIYLNLTRMDKSLIEASYDLGAKEFRTFLKVIFPLSLPGVLVGILLVFLPSIGAYVEPTLLGGSDGALISGAITWQFRGGGLFPFGSAMAVVVVAIVLAFTLMIVKSLNIKKIYPEL